MIYLIAIGFKDEFKVDEVLCGFNQNGTSSSIA